MAAQLEPKVIAWRRDFHQYPELSNREFKTADKVAAHLRALGMEVRTGIAKTGVVGILKGGRPGPVIGLRADMDALPVTERNDLPFKSLAKGPYNGAEVGVMHACGHDAHVAILMGVAEVLSTMQAQLAGTVVFVFQPAEEGPPGDEEGGAPLMIKEGLLTDTKMEVMFGLHINSQTEVGKIESGVRANIIPETAEMVGTIRTLDTAMQRQIDQKVVRTAQKIAERAGATADVRIENKTPVTYNDPALTTWALSSLREAAGTDNVIENKARTGAEDFGFFAQKIPCFYFFLGGMPKGGDEKQAPGHHTPDFYIDESGMGLGVRAFCYLVLDYLGK